MDFQGDDDLTETWFNNETPLYTCFYDVLRAGRGRKFVGNPLPEVSYGQ